MLGQRRGVLLLFWVAITMPGCSWNLAGEVAGTVTSDGKPLPAGMITIFDATQATRSGDIKEGRFTVRGVAPGKARIAIVAGEASSIAGGVPNAPRPGQARPAAPKSAIPSRYGNYQTSGLDFDIPSGGG